MWVNIKQKGSWMFIEQWKNKCTMTRITMLNTPKVNLALFFWTPLWHEWCIYLIRAHSNLQSMRATKTLHTHFCHRLNTSTQNRTGASKEAAALLCQTAFPHTHKKGGLGEGNLFSWALQWSAGTILSLLLQTTGEVRSSPCICSPCPPSPHSHAANMHQCVKIRQYPSCPDQ